jgi:hypothetical protein
VVELGVAIRFLVQHDDQLRSGCKGFSQWHRDILIGTLLDRCVSNQTPAIVPLASDSWTRWCWQRMLSWHRAPKRQSSRYQASSCVVSFFYLSAPAIALIVNGNESGVPSGARCELNATTSRHLHDFVKSRCLVTSITTLSQ